MVGEKKGPAQGMAPYVAWAVVSAVVLVLAAPALFAAGFFTNEWVSDDDGGTPAGAQLTGEGGTATAQPTAAATPTPPPAVAPTADDDPFIGPEDATVTIIEFSDYQ